MGIEAGAGRDREDGVMKIGPFCPHCGGEEHEIKRIETPNYISWTNQCTRCGRVATCVMNKDCIAKLEGESDEQIQRCSR